MFGHLESYYGKRNLTFELTRVKNYILHGTYLMSYREIAAKKDPFAGTQLIDLAIKIRYVFTSGSGIKFF